MAVRRHSRNRYEGGSRQPAVSCPDGDGDGGDGESKSSHEVRVRVGLLNLDAVETMPIALLIFGHHRVVRLSLIRLESYVHALLMLTVLFWALSRYGPVRAFDGVRSGTCG